MICVRLDGGLGNQLFQYAIGRSLADRYQSELLLDIGRLGSVTGRSSMRTFQLHHFNHVGRIASQGEEVRSKLAKFAPTIFSLFSSWRIQVENGLGYNPNFLSFPERSYLIGYWQSFRYFEDIAGLLFEELKPSAPLSKENQLIADQISLVNSIAVHVRRGDYVSDSKAARFHGALELSYYRNALAQIRNQVHEPVYFIFSDDVGWCRKNLSDDLDRVVFVHNNSGVNAWQDLELMSRCKHHIIANSSFSWWGAWIADQRYLKAERVVISPLRWFARQSNREIVDRLPAHWTRLH